MAISDTSVLGFLFRSSSGGIFATVRAGEQCTGCDVHHIEDIDGLDFPVPVAGGIGIELGGVIVSLEIAVLHMASAGIIGC